MADIKPSKELTLEQQIEQLDADHLAAQRKRQKAVDDATADLAAAEKMVREARLHVGQLQQERMSASFAYDARRAELEALIPKTKHKAA